MSRSLFLILVLACFGSLSANAEIEGENPYEVTFDPGDAYRRAMGRFLHHYDYAQEHRIGEPKALNIKKELLFLGSLVLSAEALGASYIPPKFFAEPVVFLPLTFLAGFGAFIASYHLWSTDIMRQPKIRYALDRLKSESFDKETLDRVTVATKDYESTSPSCRKGLAFLNPLRRSRVRSRLVPALGAVGVVEALGEATVGTSNTRNLGKALGIVPVAPR